MSCYGGPIPTPNIDKIAADGVRYTQWHTTALCSPTRSCLLTGRNHTRNSMACITEAAIGFPNASGTIPPENGMLSEILGELGWNTYMVGKWHLCPTDEMNLAAPRRNWPSGRGFERWYGFLGAETNQWYPELVHDNHPVEQPKMPEEGYHFTDDITDKALEFIKDAQADRPGQAVLPLLRSRRLPRAASRARGVDRIAIGVQAPKEENQDADSGLFSSLGLDSLITADTSINAKLTTFFSTDTQNLTKLRGTFKLQGAYVSGGTSYAADIEARIIDQKIYVIANTLPSFPMFDTSNFTKKWLVIGQDVTQPYFDKLSKDNTAQQDVQIARTEIANLLQLGIKSQAIIIGKVTREDLDGTSAQKVPTTFDTTKFSALAKAYEADAEKRNVKSSFVDAIVEMLNVDPTIQQATSAPTLTLTVWSNPSDHMFRKAELAVVAAENATNPASTQVHMTIGVTLAHANEQPTVVEPTGATPFMDAVGQLFSGPRAASRNAQRKSDLGQLRTGLALYFDDKNVYPGSLQAIADSRYISRLPIPPSPDEQYTYSPSKDNKTFQLCATLEKESEDGQTILYCLKNDGTTSETPNKPEA